MAELAEPDLVVGLGASAGGIAVLKEFFRHVPATTGNAYVVILHLSPEHESLLSEILQTVAAIPVRQVTERVKLEPDHAYVIAPNKSLSVVDGHLNVSDASASRRSTASRLSNVKSRERARRGLRCACSRTAPATIDWTASC